MGTHTQQKILRANLEYMQLPVIFFPVTQEILIAKIKLLFPLGLTVPHSPGPFGSVAATVRTHLVAGHAVQVLGDVGFPPGGFTAMHQQIQQHGLSHAQSQEQQLDDAILGRTTSVHSLVLRESGT